MSIKALLLAVVGLIVAGFYALESYLSFQASGFTVPLLVKLMICGAGVYLFVRNIKRIKDGSGDSSASAT
ncbi:hypothetical protein [Pseudoxanthomonas sp. PXM02]|uniref:hypothetical protein n=1 Tax=Pseudoxanthomonas sp. PXM02 TaxID=2769294 RepID=UPI001784FCEE|nr:hypothetical protein [Pseudoxanthomonas sp. PXM02]MBD9478385.1 hypothetical protein [Pseudoxanthomonas sp. PXM02]